jgi:hypothetical protein
MSKLIMVLGIALLAVGAALGILGLVYPSRLIEHSMTMDTSAILVVGGILSWALGNLTALVEKGASLAAGRSPPGEATYPLQKSLAPLPRNELPETSSPSSIGENELPPLKPSFPGFGRKATEAAAGVVAASAATAAVAADKAESMSPSVADTINALEQAKSDIRVALGVGNSPPPPVNAVAIPPPPGTLEEDELEPFQPPEDESPAAADVEEEEAVELYVVEEKLIRGRPARVLSDGTVEAETEEGWMRFENLEHLNEFLDG